MATQAAFFGQQPPPPIKKANTASSTTTESSNSKTKNGIKTVTTKYITTSREPTSAADQDTYTLSHETREYNDGTTDDITVTRKVLGGMQYDKETIIRVVTTDTGSKKKKTTYSTPYQELDPVTGKPINAFKPAAHTGPEHSKAPAELAGLIARRAPVVSGLSHDVTPVTTGPGAEQASSTTQTSSSVTKTTTASSSSAGTAPAPVAAAAPVQKNVTFKNMGTDPGMAKAELYYESTRWAALGHGDPPVTVGTFPGHRWFIVANGTYARQFTIGEEPDETFTF